MSDFFNSIRIRNFKSIRDAKLADCKRINILIGKPNVGKSNILEALSLFSLSHSRSSAYGSFSASLEAFVRFENEHELMYNGELQETTDAIRIETNLANCTVTFHQETNTQIEITGDKVQELIEIKLQSKGYSQLKHHTAPGKAFGKVKKYQFSDYKALYSSKIKSPTKFLRPPFGGNLMNIVEAYPELTADCQKLFEEYGLQLVFDKASMELRVMKQLVRGNGQISNIFLLPYNSVADTLRRIIFFKAAIVSNQNSILLFEEPEAHAFPPYIVHITQEIIRSKSNQFFIATHSPFIMNDFLENAQDELAVFIVDWQNGETTITKLTNEQLFEAYQYGVDLFTNLETFL